MGDEGSEITMGRNNKLVSQVNTWDHVINMISNRFAA